MYQKENNKSCSFDLLWCIIGQKATDGAKKILQQKCTKGVCTHRLDQKVDQRLAAWVCEERIAVYEEKEKKTNEENQESGVRNVEKTNTGHCFCALSTIVARPADQVATLSEVAKKTAKIIKRKQNESKFVTNQYLEEEEKIGLIF